MSAILRIITLPFQILLWPFRLLGRLFFRSGTTRTVHTVRKAAGELAAGRIDSTDINDGLRPALATFPFKTLERPKLTEGSATELTLETARAFVNRAPRFYQHAFDLFPQSSLFYEEIELDELAYSLAADDESSSDSRFVVWMDLFRRTLNDNVRVLNMIFTPILFVASLIGAVWLHSVAPTFESLPGLGV